MPRLLALGAAAAAFAAALETSDPALSLFLAAAAVLVAGAVWLESGLGSSRELAVVATLGGAAAAGRVLFAAIPDVQPVTVIAVAAGVGLGLRAGVGVGAIAAFSSNFFLGQGIYTPWQMLAWGGCGAIGALAAPLLRRRLPFALACCVLGLAYGVFMDTWYWWAFFPHTLSALTLALVRGLWFNVAHATGNLVLALVAGPELRRLLERYGRRLRTEVVWA